MVFWKYLPDLKYSAVCATIEGKQLDKINNHFTVTISQDSLSQWLNLYKRTRAVVCNPDTYLKQGGPVDLSKEDIGFIKELVTEDPILYVDKIHCCLADQHGVSVSISTILNMPHEREDVQKINTHGQPKGRTRQLSGLHCSSFVFAD